LDLLLHTPGGEIAAMESLVDYLHSMFGDNIRAIIPQLALSAGTMIACACQNIIMGKHSSLGSIDPQFQGLPAHAIIEEFEKAYQEIKADQHKAAVWNPILSRYSPSLVGECRKAIEWTNEMVKTWLSEGMFKNVDQDKKNSLIHNIIEELGNHAVSKSHARHLSAQKCHDIGLKVEFMEEDQKLQDAILSVHHATIHTLASTNACKIIENHHGVSFIQALVS